MDTELNDTQRLLVDSAVEFLDREMVPGRAAAVEASDEGYDVRLTAALGELGWAGICIAEVYGGAGSPLLDAALVYEQLCRGAALTPFAQVIAAARVIERYADEGTKSELLPQIAAGRFVTSSAFLDDTDDFDAPPTAEVVQQSGGLRITGKKRFAGFAHAADALLVSARLPGGTGLAVVPRSPEVRAVRTKVIGGTPLCTVEFESAPVLTLIAEPEATAELLRVHRALNAVASVGYGGRALEMTIDYVKERVQFGRPIGMFEAVQQMAANMAIWMEGARWLAYQGVWALDDDEMSADKRDLEVRMAAAHAGWAARETAMLSHQLHGGVGFMLEYDLHYYSRRAKEAEILWGTPAEHYRAVGHSALSAGERAGR